MTSLTTLSFVESFTTSNGSNVTLPSGRIPCSLFDGDQHKCNVIIAVKRTAASISLIGCLFMMFIILLFRKWPILTQRLILCLTVGGLFRSIAYIVGDDYPPGAVCNFQAWMLTSFHWMVLLWVCCITTNMFISVIKMSETDQYEWIYHLVSWGLPFFLSFLPFTGGHYGPAGVWCWIEKDHGWRMGLWFGPLFILITVMLVMYIYIIVTVRKRNKNWEGLYNHDRQRQQKLLEDEVTPLIAYPLIYLALSIFPLINRIQNAVSDTPVFGLVLMHAMTTPLLGAANVIAFGLDKQTAGKLTPTNIWMQIQSRKEENLGVIREYPSTTTAKCMDYNESVFASNLEGNMDSFPNRPYSPSKSEEHVTVSDAKASVI